MYAGRVSAVALPTVYVAAGGDGEGVLDQVALGAAAVGLAVLEADAGEGDLGGAGVVDLEPLEAVVVGAGGVGHDLGDHELALGERGLAGADVGVDGVVVAAGRGEQEEGGDEAIQAGSVHGVSEICVRLVKRG
jgi:hypothetical protein